MCVVRGTAMRVTYVYICMFYVHTCGHTCMYMMCTVPPHVYTCKLNFFLKKELRTEKDFGNLSSVCATGIQI